MKCILWLTILLSLSAPSIGVAQESPAFSLALVEDYVKHNVRLARAKQEFLKSGVSFHMDADAEARLRRAGATDEWINLLRQTRYVPAATGSLQPVPPTRDQLRPLYFGREARITPYVGVMRLRETGGAVAAQVYQSERGPVALNSTPLTASAVTYGLVVDYFSVGLDFEGYFHQRDLLMLNLGMRFAPFLPLGTSGARLIVGVEPITGITRQQLAHLSRLPSDTTAPIVDLLNHTFGGDLSAGLAYHWGPGSWAFVEIHYRHMKTFARELRVPGQAEISQGIPWSEWSARGLMLRLGIGF